MAKHGPLLLCAGALAIVLGLLWWLRADAGHFGEDASVSTPARVPATTLAAGAGDGDQEPPVGAPERTAVAPRAPLRVGEFGVRIVRAEDRRPLPGAEAWFVDTAATPSALHAPQAFTGRDPFTLVRALGRRCIADAEGIVVVSSATGHVAVAASFEDLVGFAGLQPPEPEGGYVLELSPRAPLTIEVVDAGGVPVAGAPLAVLVWRGSWSMNRSDIGVTDARGRLTVEHPAPLWPGGRVTRAAAAVCAPGLGTCAADFDPRTLAREPVRVVLPATGRIELLLATGPDLPLRDVAVAVGLRSHGRDEPPVDAALRTDAAGRGEVTRVALGRPMRLQVETAPSRFFVDFDGPARAGETVQVAGRPEHDRTVLHARVADQNGAVLGDMAFDLQVVRVLPGGRVHDSRSAVRADAEGRVLCVLDEMFAPATRVDVRLRAAGTTRRADPREAEFSLPGPFAPGFRDLGVLVVRRLEAFMSGHVVASDGRPVAHATATFPAASIERPAPRFQLDEDGAFALFARETALPDAMRLLAPGCMPLDVPARAGVHGLRVVLPRAGSVAVQVQFDDGLTSAHDSLRCELQSPDGATREERMSRGELGARAEFAPLEGGSYTVRVWLAGQREPLLAEAIALGPPTGWQRHVVVDLRGKLRALRARVLAADTGLPLPSSVVVVGDPHPVRGTFARAGVRCDPEGIAHVVTFDPTVALVAEAPGYLPLSAVRPAADCDLVLERLPELDVRLSEGASLPAGARVSFDLVSPATSSAGDWISGRRRNDPRQTSGPLVDGRARVRVPALGPIEVRLTVVLPGSPPASRAVRVEPSVVDMATRALILFP